jgi:hypothetical protein
MTDEFEKLLSQLDDDDDAEVTPAPISNPEPASEPKASPEKKKRKEPVASEDFIETEKIREVKVDDLDELESGVEVASVIRPLDKDVTTAETTAPQTNAAPNDSTERINKYAEQLEIVTNEILTACRADRTEVQKLIDNFSDRLEHFTDGPPPKSLIDGLVQAVEVKSGINLNAIKIMDTNAKFISATKSTSNTQNNLNIGGSAEELRKILGSSADDF